MLLQSKAVSDDRMTVSDNRTVTDNNTRTTKWHKYVANNDGSSMTFSFSTTSIFIVSDFLLELSSLKFIVRTSIKPSVAVTLRCFSDLLCQELGLGKNSTAVSGV